MAKVIVSVGAGLDAARDVFDFGDKCRRWGEIIDPMWLLLLMLLLLLWWSWLVVTRHWRLMPHFDPVVLVLMMLVVLWLILWLN